ncbi:hypothetical protein AB0H23_27340 [Streptomyces albogriseolus]|uniref:hypothetical protein n=1 Tax=Streptomyces albogriseolus TaxID=1887 RepID=UPI00345FA6BC
MADEPAKTPIQSKYAQQYADDLAANREEQGDVTAQITGLQERLAQLKSEEEWLAQALASLPEAPPSDAVEQAEAPVPAKTVADTPQSVPQQRQDQPVTEEKPRKPAKKTAPAKKTTPKKAAKTTAKKTTARTTAKKAVAKKTAAEEAPAQPAAAEAPADTATAKEKSGPPLWQLALDILLKTPGQPYVAKEVRDQLAQDHPGRATSVQAVRNNLETLVKKGLAEKSNQQGSAMYTAYADTDADAAPAADGTAAGEAGQVPEAAAGKVPAEV